MSVCVTPAGEFLCEFWLPVAKSVEFTRDGDPLRLMALGEKLIGSRDMEGRLGIFDHRWPHRCASQFFARNEEGGLRCAYHGWKFDVDDMCFDMPNMLSTQRAHGIRAKAYQVWIQVGRADARCRAAARHGLRVRAERMQRLISCQYRRHGYSRSDWSAGAERAPLPHASLRVTSARQATRGPAETGAMMDSYEERAYGLERLVSWEMASMVQDEEEVGRQDLHRANQGTNIYRLYDAPGHIARRLIQRINAQFEEDVLPRGLTVPQFAILWIVYLVPDSEQAEIAALAYYDGATTGGVISRLLDRELVQRTRSNRSRRGWQVRLTDKGRALIEAMQPALDKVQHRLFYMLDERERQTFLWLLSRVAGVENSYSAQEPD